MVEALIGMTVVAGIIIVVHCLNKWAERDE